jgi:hypothetical protein
LLANPLQLPLFVFIPIFSSLFFSVFFRSFSSVRPGGRSSKGPVCFHVSPDVFPLAGKIPQSTVFQRAPFGRLEERPNKKAVFPVAET